MTIPSLETITSFLTVFAAIMGALLAALWLSLIIWAFRDMRARSRDPFAQILAALVVAALPFVGIIIYFILRPPETLAQAYERALEEEALLQEIEERPACPGCSRTIDGNWILCPYCHTRLRKACPDCHALMELSWNLCPFCGNQHVDPYHVSLPVTEPGLSSLPEADEPAAPTTHPEHELQPDAEEDQATVATPMPKEGR
jgi:RNA polymerase subunit RPABC4/transcription elongation factor Spt4